MKPKAQNLYSLIRNIRTCFNLLKMVADDLHEDLGITASMRAVIETVAENGEQTVPQIARVKGVSRQHIQVNVDALRDGAFVVLRKNPAHKRSPFVALTERGQSAFAEMRQREQGILEEMASKHSMDSLKSASDTLLQLKEYLFTITEKGKK